MGKDVSASTTTPPPGGKKAPRRKGPKKIKPKMTKEERRAKYTAIARGRRDSHMSRQREKHLVCYRCRKTGHSAENCTEAAPDGAGGGGGKGTTTPPSQRKRGGGNICYKCGSFEHRIQTCPKIKPFLRPGRAKLDFGKLGDLPYANCYVCNKSGHLASYCPESSRGVYPRGGSCRECGSVDHYAADCPEKKKLGKNRPGDEDDDASNASSNPATIDQYLEEPAAEDEVKKIAKKKKKVVNF
mmetsp:Transcript_3664/g.7655  ORF Transcript_3664/g.7655 Transcript_3664/m.7655 type:complete len:242 (-) Transcript_3664:209-934(-)|eukprot:CAMPEP_0172526834 /NCGR_PEP_ID=MMETSP1067-20121228/1669_1 /TAXON_ID=265564 ORGANISM="Thalassiosira punctigera, Strain Tpunct2005C2" /NCGR_SAMPLE_ID=MMETSP1067 /ASSEMBLY_ACC=CAM_ASM_000444 /LENGTH=241 /DNA_ID=CAMNT_0013310439 /DNA_START=105 /DNA_END=830 /DNA_ORIENTATION=-